jgi:hypothetical protein
MTGCNDILSAFWKKNELNPLFSLIPSKRDCCGLPTSELITCQNGKAIALNFSGRGLNGWIPSELALFLPDLKNLDLSNNSLHNVIPASLANMTSLTAM